MKSQRSDFSLACGGLCGVRQGGLSLLLAGVLASRLCGAVLINDDFSKPPFVDGDLAGQGGWAQDGTIDTFPIQVTSGEVVMPQLTGNHQDVDKAFAVTSVGGQQVVFAIRVVILNAPTSGPAFFLALEEDGPNGFDNFRLAAVETSPGFFQFRVRATGQSANPYTTTGASLPYNTEHIVMGSWNFVSGAEDDYINLFVNPSSPVEMDNPVYATQVQSASGSDPGGFQSIILSQFESATAKPSSLLVRQVVVATTFAEAYQAIIPEPEGWVLLTIGIVGLIVFRRLCRASSQVV